MKLTDAQKHAAFYKAADYIERHPGEYRFSKTRVPSPGECGCSWGHVGVAIGVNAGADIGHVARHLGFGCQMVFYHFAIGEDMRYAHGYAKTAPAKLRAFADHHWPQEKAMPFAELMRSVGAEVAA